MLRPQAFIDDSGNEPTKPHFVLAGFVAAAANWAAFSDEWRAALDESPRLDYFKMKEAAGLKDQFDPKNGWNEQKRDDRLILLTRIIRKYVGIRIHAKVVHSDFDKYVKSIPVPYRKLLSDNPYILLFSQIIMAMSARQELFGVDPCDFIFDEQAGFDVEAISSWPSIKETLIRHRRPGFANIVGSPPIFRNEREVLPLQAADLYAWQMRNYFFQNRLIIAPVNRVLGQLVSIPMIDRDIDEREMKELHNSLLSTEICFANKIRTSRSFR